MIRLSGARRLAALRAAADFLHDEGITRLPFDPFRAIAARENWQLYTYAAFDRMDPDGAVRAVQIARDAFSRPVLCGGKPVFMILYNQDIRSGERIRFSLCHEIGHIVLGHHAAAASSCRPESAEEEAQANLFAAAVLAPPAVVRQIRSPEQARALLGVSPEAFERSRREAESDCALMGEALTARQEARFEAFMHRRRCLRCGHVWIHPDAGASCPACGSFRVRWSGLDDAPPGPPAFPWDEESWQVSRKELLEVLARSAVPENPMVPEH